MLKFYIAFGASFGEKIDRVMSGHRAMTSQKEQGQTIFARIGGVLHMIEVRDSKHNGRGLMAISAIVASLLSCKFPEN